MPFHLKKLLPLLVTAFLFGYNSGSILASHSMGSDLTYRCLGGNTYEITLSFYRDCAGIPADQSATIDFTSSCFPDAYAILNLIPNTGQEITPLCPSQVSTCNGGTFTGIQEYIYRGTVTLPGPCADWTMSYNLCCRNDAEPLQNHRAAGGVLEQDAEALCGGAAGPLAGRIEGPRRLWAE